MTTFDDILEEAGPFGRCQKRIFALFCLVSMPWAGVYVGIVFQGFTPDHWCRDPAVVERRQACGWSLADSRRLTVPPVNGSGTPPQRSSCERYEVDWNRTALACDTRELDLGTTPTTSCKDGWEYDYEGRQSFVTEFDLVCSEGWLVDMYQASLNVGFLVGSIAIGYMADRFGRKMSFLLSNLLNGVAGILVAVAPNYVSLLVFRTLYGFGVKGGWVAGYVLITEIVGVEYRRTVGVIYQMFFSVGILLLPLLAYFITDWRWLQVVITAPYLLFLSYYWFIPESPRWLLSQNKKAKAVKITEDMAKENKMTLSKNIETLADDNADFTTASFMDLIRTPKMRKHTLILSYNWFTSAVVYQGLIMRLGILGGNVYIDFLIAGLVEFPAAFLILFTIERVGRRLPFATANFVAGVSCFVTAFIPDRSLAFLAGGLVLLLPETRGVQLPDTIDDIEFPDRRQACGWSLADSRRLTVPPVNGSGTPPQRSSCERYEVDWNTTGLTCDTQELDLRGVPVSSCKDAWEYQYEGRTSFVTEFHLVCEDGWLVDMYQATLNVGFLAGSFAFGFFADRFGRKISFLASNLLNAIAGIVLAVTPNYVSILVVRTIFGFGVKGGWMTTYVLLTEIVGVEHRRTVGILYQMFFSVGVLVLPLLAYFITDWRWLQVTISAPYVLFLCYYWFIPESPRWLISQNKSSKALEITEAMAKENGRKLTKSFETLTCDESDSCSASLLDLFKTPNMRKHTFILMFNWFTSAVVYQGLIMRVGITGGNVYIDFLIAGLVEFPAAFLILFTIERVGRRVPFAAANIVAGASCFVTALIPDSMFWSKTMVACVGRLGITMAFEMVVFVNTELYPTFVRNLGVSVCSTLCDVGGIVAPFLLYRLAGIWLELPLIIFGTVALIAGGLVLLLPETRGVPLPETIDDIEFPNRKKENPLENHNQ
ncbi:hypothetical protein F2P81_024495 [Scophthalmus maximus]|uniref:Solute carrier family 22 member 3 n=1 Tax=Scophthalmus maximus TaxID=52904 RepID=A0A6A4RUF3_SCOMX|nr:hypothetical protein F2P81_024495 [Scophthalmus maximus]